MAFQLHMITLVATFLRWSAAVIMSIVTLQNTVYWSTYRTSLTYLSELTLSA